MITEARDSLLDTAEALESTGLGREEAERAAVREFGTVGEIAPGYQEELTISAGRRLAALLFLGMPLTTIMWSVLWRIFPAAPAVRETVPGWFSPVALGLDVVQLFIGLIGGVALFALGRGLRGISRPRVVTRSLAMFVWAMLPVTLALCGAVLLGAQGSTDFGDHLPGTVVSLVTHGFWLMQLYGAFRCLSLTQRGPVPGTA